MNYKDKFTIKKSFSQTTLTNPKSKETNNIIQDLNQKQNDNMISKFERLQPEIIYQISEFLTFDQYLQLRLINRFMNQRIQYISPLKLQSIKSKIQYFESQLYEQVKSKDDYQKQETEFKIVDKQIKLLISDLNLASMLEVRAYNNPPQIIQQIFMYLMILLNYQIQKQKNTWNQIQQFLSFPFNIIVKLNSIKISKITQSQLQTLLPILEISTQEVFNISQAGGIICLVIQLIIDVNHSCQLIIQQENIEREIRNNLNKEDLLNKIISLNKN